ncbi:hypothetical protein ACFQHO_50275 [Actinomadura yumaensis]|uniref:hypothetical protein n=1 Tax=Actinomadura TaxID=1988 RepID=UPI001328B0F0|nr:hypothetical protein [Actinomadura sp. J1-007]MWK40374.1 hypothetical protein [Actinomadura sp. J1-007]
MNGVRLSTVIMAHPARAALLPALIDACAGLAPRIVFDPDPAGPPSPLRTAKRAWAAVASGATHHLVLQDDVIPVAGFVEQVCRAIEAKPEHGLALCVNWNSPHNSYYARRAAAVGSPWAPLSTTEWMPTLGLVLPADAALGLAAHLHRVPDDFVDEDEVVVEFCRIRGLPVVAALPNLVDHAGVPSLTAHYLVSHAITLPADVPPLEEGHWSAMAAAEPFLTERVTDVSRRRYTVELWDSECSLRFVRDEAGEAVEHPFSWYWYDWCPLAGIDPREIVAAYREDATPGVPPEIGLEVWAAGFLLGSDAATTMRDAPAEALSPALPPATAAGLLRGVVASWVRSGLVPEDLADLDDPARAALVDLGVAAVAAARTGRRRVPTAAAGR